jgi:DNA-binding response OmpR family regulator
MTGIRILLVEDDPDISDLLQAALEPSFECLRATNGLEGFQFALAGEPDLIISDIMMPIMDGYEFIRRVRKESRFSNTPVIFLSALGTREKIRAGYDLGAALYLTKPIDPVRMKRNVELFIEDHGVTARPKLKSVKEVQDSFLNPEVAEMEDTRPPTSPPTPSASAVSLESPTPDPPPHNAAPATGAKPRVMVVEDERDIVETIKETLHDQYEFTQAFDGIEAIERAVRFEPDIFIIDGMLPKMTGYQLVTMLKKNRIFSHHPIVMMSAKASNRDRQYIEKLGVKYFLPKPFEYDHLRATIDSIAGDPAFKVGKKRVNERQMALETLRDFESHR